MANWQNGMAKVAQQNVLVLGAARSGISAARLLLRLGAKVLLNDRNVPDAKEHWVDELRAAGARVVVGEHPAGLLEEGFDLIVKNPGIPYRHPYITEAERLGIPIITEVELGYAIMEGELIGITGSNGKTTTTTLVGEIFSEAKREAIVAGNIGHVFCEQMTSSTPRSTIVAELSSFQLKGTLELRPHIACLLNVFHHHLDYHETYDDYVASKMKLFANQTSADFAVLNWDQAHVRALGAAIHAQVYWFSRNERVRRGAYIEQVDRDGGTERWVCFVGDDGVIQPIIAVADILLVGEHNLENVLASVTIALLSGVATEAIRTVLRRFRGVEHRLEFVAEHDGVRYYNDSKATNPEATEKAIQSFTAPLILIAGGMERGENLDALVPLFATHVHTLLAYGETKERFYQIGVAAGVAHVERVADVREAALRAAALAQRGDVVLLSPACASWDLYTSFEERGRMFKEALHTLL